MTPLQIEEAARNRYNSIGDSFWSQEEILMLIYAGAVEMSVECHNVEATYTTSTVASQQEYSYPANTILIKRVTYNGQKLEPITMREDDVITGYEQDTSSTGVPAYYFIWNDVIYLRPVPTDVATLKIFSVNEHSSVTATSTMELPSRTHMDLVYYVVGHMCAKDQNFSAAADYMKLWDKAILKEKRHVQKKKRGDSFSSVQCEEPPGI